MVSLKKAVSKDLIEWKPGVYSRGFSYWVTTVYASLIPMVRKI